MRLIMRLPFRRSAPLALALAILCSGCASRTQAPFAPIFVAVQPVSQMQEFLDRSIQVFYFRFGEVGESPLFGGPGFGTRANSIRSMRRLGIRIFSRRRYGSGSLPSAKTFSSHLSRGTKTNGSRTSASCLCRPQSLFPGNGISRARDAGAKVTCV
jgi:hypothetical protein